MTGVEIEKMKSCTICLEEGEDVTNYCSCTKSVAAYHRECLREYVKKTGVRRCWFCEDNFEGGELKNEQNKIMRLDEINRWSISRRVFSLVKIAVDLILKYVMLLHAFRGDGLTWLAFALFSLIHVLITWIEIEMDARGLINDI